MGRGTRTRIARNIYRDRSGYSVIYRSGGRPIEKRFDLDTPIRVLKDYQRHKEATALKPPTTDRVGLARDVVRFLKLRKHLPCYKSDRAHLRPWVHRFKGRSRWAITRDDCARAIAEWSATYSAREVRHRVQIFRLLFTTLDGAGAASPVDHLDLPRIPKPRPMSVSDAKVREVAEELKRHENLGYIRSAKTRARYLVLATTGQRPAQMMRATPDTVDLARRLWFVLPAKGDRGTVVYLNDDMLAAWQLFVQANAWGRYDTRSFAKTLRSCGWPRGVRPYALRHTVGLSLSERGVDLGDIQAHMGHSSPTTTRTFYVPTLLNRLQQASATLDGRLDGLAVPSRRAMTARKSKQEHPGKPRKTEDTAAAPTRGTARQDRKKTA